MMRTARVTLILSSLKMGGTERVVSAVANGLAERGYQISLVTWSEPEIDFFTLGKEITRVRVETVPRKTGSKVFKPWFRLNAIVKNQLHLRAEIKTTRPDLVLAFSGQTNVRVLMALAFSGIKVVISERNNPRLKKERAAFEHLKKTLYPRASCLVSPSSRLSAMFAWLPAEKRVVIPNPVLMKAKRNGPVVPVPKWLGSSVVLSMGRLEEQKGFDTLIYAFGRIRDKVPDSKLIILGEGTEKESLEHLARGLGIGESILFPGKVANVEEWLFSTTTFVLSSRFEGFPNALLEAMACGVPCVSTNCETGPDEMIINGENGFLVPVGDSESMANRVVQLLQDCELRRRFGENGLAKSRIFSQDKVFSAWSELIEKVSGARGDSKSPL